MRYEDELKESKLRIENPEKDQVEPKISAACEVMFSFSKCLLIIKK
jgi:hypothetical protein